MMELSMGSPKARFQRSRLIWFWKYLGVSLVLIFSWMAITVFPASASTVAKEPATEVKISLGNSGGELKFFPNKLEFRADQKYKLVLDNPSPEKHYFTAKNFADVSWTQKVEAGQVEVKGAIHEVELKPGAEAEWVLIPMKPGTYELHCSIPGHAEAGMVGEIVVNP